MLPEPSSPRESSAVRPGFEDGLGRRYRPSTRLDTEAPLEILCIRHEITDVPAFEFALRERVARLSDLKHPSFPRIRKVDRLNDERGTVVLMSDGAAGTRLSDILIDRERTGVPVDVQKALSLVRQLMSAIAALHRDARVSHGAIAPERLFVTADGQILLAEYALGAALEQLKYSRERYWKELRVALPMNVGLSRFDERADLTQVGVVAVSLLLGRPLRDDEYPRQIEELLTSACERTGDSTHPVPPPGLREWLRRTLQLDVRGAFHSMADAEAGLDALLSEDQPGAAEPDSLEAFMHRESRSPEPAASPAPAPAAMSELSDTPAATPPYESLSIASAEISDERAQELDDDEDAMRAAQSGGRGRIKWIVAGIVLLAVMTAGLFAARNRFSPAAPPVTTGRLSVNTDPPGAEVEVDGQQRGRSPLSLELPAGAHTLVVRANGETRNIPVTIAAGADISQYLELPKAGSGFGQLHVRTEPAGARISFDGTPLGKTPMTIVEIVPGEHTVSLESELGSVTQKVMIEAGVAASLVVPMGGQPGAVASGWVSVTAPVDVDLRENDRLLGTSSIDRIMLPSGKHEIELVNEQIGYREARTIHVSPGRVTAVSVTMPKGSVSLNAVPWASVSIDGESVGDTPIGNYPLTVGQHEVVFRNAELGEQRRVITVTLRAPVRLSVDLTKK
jgi:hypothetical protein